MVGEEEEIISLPAYETYVVGEKPEGYVPSGFFVCVPFGSAFSLI